MIRNVLSIAGTDPSGGAGIQADLKAFSAMGAYGMAAITAVVAQNTCGVRRFETLAPAFVADQIDAVFEDVRVDAVKIGMVATAAIAEVVAERLRLHGASIVVLDPVMVAKSGDHLLARDAVEAIRDCLAPLATLITPNLPEAAVLLGEPEPGSVDDMLAMSEQLAALGAPWVLLKGGHLREENSVDLLWGDGVVTRYSQPRVATRNDHGTGCTLSAAIAALLPDHVMGDAVGIAKTYLTRALERSSELQVGRGHGPVHHFHALWPE